MEKYYIWLLLALGVWKILIAESQSAQRELELRVGVGKWMFSILLIL